MSITTITATAEGSRIPEEKTHPDRVSNGDFTITGGEGEPDVHIVGNGRDETTTWTFDFNGDPGHTHFTDWLPLTSALLTLTLTTKYEKITTDWVSIGRESIDYVRSDGERIEWDRHAEHRRVYTPLIQHLLLGHTSTVFLELLNWYTSDEILGCLFGGEGGTLPMMYADDAIVSFAKLQLTQGIQYAAKVVCGQGGGKVLASGVYRTAVNVHNPSGKDVRFRTKVAVARPGKPGKVSGFEEHRLPPDGAIEFDCPQLRQRVERKKKLLKGFFVIESAAELDVVAVYTAGGRDGEVTSIHTERVPARKAC